MSNAQSWLKVGEQVTRVGWRTIVTKRFRMPAGELAEYTTVGRPNGHCAAVIALTVDRRVVIARQFRAGPERVLDELPGGIVDEGEDPAAAAVRELREETGYVSDRQPTPLGTGCRDATSNETNHYFLLTDCRRAGPPEPDDGEFIEPALISVDELIRNATTANMSNGIAVLMAYDLLLNHRA